MNSDAHKLTVILYILLYGMQPYNPMKGFVYIFICN